MSSWLQGFTVENVWDISTLFSGKIFEELSKTEVTRDEVLGLRLCHIELKCETVDLVAHFYYLLLKLSSMQDG